MTLPKKLLLYPILPDRPPTAEQSLDDSGPGGGLTPELPHGGEGLTETRDASVRLGEDEVCG